MSPNPNRRNHDDAHPCDETGPHTDSPDVPFTTGPLFDALSSGEPPNADDDLAVLLAGWRDDLTTGLDTTTRAPHRPETRSRPASLIARRPRRPRPTRPRPTGPPPGRQSARRSGRLFRAAAAAAVSFVTLLAGIGIGSYESSPGSPLWPVAQVLYPSHTDVVAIESTIAQARSAIAAGAREEAAKLINLSRHQLVEAYDDLDQDTVDRLLAEIDALVLALASVVIPAPEPDIRNPAPPTHTPAPAPTRTPDKPKPSAPSPQPSPTKSGLPPRLDLPDLLPIPSPSPSPSSSPGGQLPPAPPKDSGDAADGVTGLVCGVGELVGGICEE